jgi:hypothetical protein
VELSRIDQSMTPVPLEVAGTEIGEGTVLAAMPVREVEGGTACVLVAREGQLWIASRVSGGGSTASPGVAVDAVEWHEVAIGPQGIVGRVPGGLLGGPEASYHLVTVQAGSRLYEAKLPGSSGMEMVEDFVSVALHAGAHELEL